MPDQSLALKKILVATDLSDQAGAAIGRAVELGIEHEAEVIIVHIVQEGLPQEAESFLMATSDRHVRDGIADLPRASQVTMTIDIVSGRPDLDIVERAELEQADLIVVGLHSRLLEENLSIQGTVAEQIIQRTHLPVLVVKNKPSGPYRSVLVGVDFSAFSREAVGAAVRVAPHADLYLTHAYQVNTDVMIAFRRSEARDKMAAARKLRLEAFIHGEMNRLMNVGSAGKLKFHQNARIGEPSAVLKAEAKRIGAELVVMGTHGRIGLKRSILGSVTTDLLNDRLADVLTVRPF